MPSIDLHHSLDHQERCVLGGMVRGQSVQDIADEMRLPIEEVREVRCGLLTKLNARCNADLVRTGLIAGLR